MKNRIFKAFTILSLFAIMAVSAYAQCVGNMVVMKIPFEFVAGDKTFPAGEYTIKSVTQHSTALLIRSEDCREHAIVVTQAVGNRGGEIQDETKLVFNRYGNRHFLSQIWVSGYSAGRELLKSHTEIEMAKSASKTQSVLLAARR